MRFTLSRTNSGKNSQSYKTSRRLLSNVLIVQYKTNSEVKVGEVCVNFAGCGDNFFIAFTSGAKTR